MIGHRGFTLIEVLVALAVFAVVSAISFSGIMLLIDQRDRVTASSERLEAIQMAVAFLERDLRHASARPVRDPLGSPRPALLSGDLADLEFTRGGRANPLGLRRSELQRVGYQLQDEELRRLQWLVLDQQPDPERRERTLLEGVTAVELRFMGNNGDWQQTWPPAEARPGTARLPRAVAITLELTDLGRIRRVITLPDGPPPGAASPEASS